MPGVRIIITTSATLAVSVALCGLGAGLARGGTRAAARAASDQATVPAVRLAEDVVVGGAGVGLLCVGLWSLAVWTVWVGDVVTDRTHVVGGTCRPPRLRRFLLRCTVPALGVSVGGLGSALAATADPGAVPAAEPGGGLSALTGLALPDLPVSVVRSEPADGPGGVRVRVVGPGECLWTIAGSTLARSAGESPDVAEVDRAWRHLYRANRTRIGPDPDLLVPGLRLRVPGALSAPRP